jgi:heme-degrading monooxygenase HmoA
MSHSPDSRGGEMFARVTLGEALPERLDRMTREITEHVLPALRMQDGFAGAMVLADRSSGKVLAVTLWETEQAMDSTEEAAYWLRVFSAEAAGGKVSGVDRYEVAFSDVERLRLGGEPPTTDPPGT